MNPPFRVAREAPVAWNLAKTFAQVVVFWTFFLAVLPAGIRYAEARLGIQPILVPGQVASGAVLFAVLSALGLWSGITMSWLGAGTPLPVDAPRKLVIAGPYRFVRNPMAIAGLGQGLAVAIATGSPMTVAYVLTGGLLWNALARPLEEADLRRRFGADFDDYARRVRCWWPRWPRD